jgi:uncharacterized sulfatase
MVKYSIMKLRPIERLRGLNRVDLTAIVIILLCSVCPAAAREDRRPNLVVIMTDDQARWSLGAHGNTDSRTPNMDRIAREGAIFNNAFVNTPVCSPSRATFFTGRHGTQLGITDWINGVENDNGVGIPPTSVTWPEVLQKHGYRTSLTGKWHLGMQEQFHPTKHGFDHFAGFLGGGSAPMDPRLEIGGKLEKREGPVPDLLTNEAIKFVEENRSRPFALCLFFREPHQPYHPVPPEDSNPFVDLDPKIPDVPFIDKEQTKDRHRRYYASIHAADRNTGRLLDKLDELGLSENTIVLFTSDHGYNIGHHGIYTKGNASWVAGGVQGPKRPNMFEESIRVPLLVRWPGVVKPGSKIDAMVMNQDTFASVLGMLDIPLPDDAKHEGMDFSPLLRGEDVKWRDEIYGQYDLHNSGLAFMRMIRTDRWKLVRHHMSNGLNELYDLKTDPGETQNLYRRPKARETRDELQARLTKWQESIDDPLLRLDADRPIEAPLQENN